jgi:hypothetical protein
VFRWVNKLSTRCNRCFFIAGLIACSTCSGHHYAYHQELESIIQLVAACGLWCLVLKLSVRCGAEGCVFRFAGCCGHPTLSSIPYWRLENQAPKTTGGKQLYNTLELLMMGIETCWASNKISNKKHLLHLVGILFPHINDDARSESIYVFWVSLQILSVTFCALRRNDQNVYRSSCNVPFHSSFIGIQP